MELTNARQKTRAIAEHETVRHQRRGIGKYNNEKGTALDRWDERQEESADARCAALTTELEKEREARRCAEEKLRLLSSLMEQRESKVVLDPSSVMLSSSNVREVDEQNSSRQLDTELGAELRTRRIEAVERIHVATNKFLELVAPQQPPQRQYPAEQIEAAVLVREGELQNEYRQKVEKFDALLEERTAQLHESNRVVEQLRTHVEQIKKELSRLQQTTKNYREIHRVLEHGESVAFPQPPSRKQEDAASSARILHSMRNASHVPREFCPLEQRGPRQRSTHSAAERLSSNIVLELKINGFRVESNYHL